jgi:hypothetical protein
MFWNSSRSPLEAEEEEWLLSCWEWLLGGLSAPAEFRQFPLVLPTNEYFPPTQAAGHAMAVHVFDCVARLTGTAGWPYKLVPQAENINPVLGPLAAVKNAGSNPAGTFSVEERQEIVITYDPALIARPSNLIATFAHEIAHGLVLTISSEPPGGEEYEEYAVDVTAAFLGFGLFGANHAFEFRQFSDTSTGTQGWSYRRTGYLSEAQWGFCLALFLALRGEPAEAALRWLKPGPAGALKKTMKYLAKHKPDAFVRLTAACAAS